MNRWVYAAGRAEKKRRVTVLCAYHYVARIPYLFYHNVVVTRDCTEVAGRPREMLPRVSATSPY